MTQWHTKSKKKPSGGFRNSINRSNKRLYFRGSDPTHTVLAKTEQKRTSRGRGGNLKLKLQRAHKALVSDQKTKKTFSAEILGEVANDADKQFVRRNVLTKGGIIKISHSGKELFARISSRPGQSGAIQAILVEEPAIKAEAMQEKAKKRAMAKQKSSPQALKPSKQPIETA